MARALPVSDTLAYGHESNPGEWHALRSELVELLDHVEGQYTRASAQQPGYDALAMRMRELRYQVAETPATNRHQEALRSVKRAVDRFSERDEGVVRTNPQDVLQSAIQEIRLRQRGPAQGGQPAPQQIDRFAQSITALTERLERLEGEIRAQRDGGDNVKIIGEQVSQLTHVVELLAGAVGETGQVKRLESQIAGLAEIISSGRNADVMALTARLEDVAGTIDTLARSQANDESRNALGEQQAMLGHGMHAIEENVRNIYDRIDAIEKNVAMAPADFNKLTEDMAAFTEEMRSATAQARPNQLLARVDALNARLADIEGKDGLVGHLQDDIDALRTAIVDAFEPRFVAIENQLVSINDRLQAGRKPDPSIAQIEIQIRQLVTRMDETGAQLNSLAQLYNQPEAREPAPDFEALASLVAKRTSDAFNQNAAPAGNGISDETFAELEKRMSRLFAAANKDKVQEDFSDVHDGIRRVDERLDRLEAALSGRKLADDVVTAAAPASAPAPAQSQPLSAMQRVLPTDDIMPISPAVEAPLVDKVFAGATRTPPVSETAQAKARETMFADVGPSQSAGMRPVTPEMVGGKTKAPAEKPLATKVPAEAVTPVFDPNAVARPPRPESSLDRQAREAFATAPTAAPKVSDAVTPPDAPDLASAASTNTFIAAHRRMARRQAETSPETGSNSLIGRAMARFQSNAEKAEAPGAQTVAPVADVVPAVEMPKPAKAKKVKEPKAAKIALGTEEPEQPSFLRRHRQPLLLAATLVAVGLLTINLINQRMGEPAAEPAAAIQENVPAAEPASVEPPAAKPTGDISAIDAKPATNVRAIPGTGADAIDPMAVGSINPMGAMNFSTAPEVPAIPPALGFAATNATTSAQPVGAEAPLEASPVKVELPPEALGPLPLRQAAADGDARAQFEVAAIYTEGRAVTQDYAQALIWYERSAAQGFAPAQYRLGNLYEGGKGTEKDLEQARLWYQRAAEAGNRMSMHNLAALYAGGSLGKQEFEQAAEWFEQAASRGMTDSQFNLGMLYARGLGVKQDMEASYKWFSLAAGNGDKDAAKARDDVAKSLDAATVQRLAADVTGWKEVPIDLAANFAPIGTWAKDFDAGQAITNKAVVEKVQTALVKLGYDIGTPDGLAGPKTAVAIKAFEKATGMTEIGAINPRLLAVLGSQPV